MKKKEKKVCNCEEKCECDEKCCDCSHECNCDENCCEHDCNCECDAEDIVNEINELHKKVSELEEKLSEAEDKAKRAAAETINYRERKEKEYQKREKYCNEDLIQEILPSLDNFERAISLDDTNLNDELSKFLSGFKMIYCHICNALEKFGVKAIDGYNKPFDPVYHNAIMTEKVEGVEPGMVVEVLQKGYLLKDKVIRTAMVKVSE